jgi:hypothetical protein
VSEERKPVHTQEPAEGADEDVEAPGAERSGDPSNPASADDAGTEKRAGHPEDQVDND